MTETAAAPGLAPIGNPAATSATASPDLLKVQSADLLRGARELLILHNGETYRLRLTSNDKLILTK